MSLMDALPELRWCCDADRGGVPEDLVILVEDVDVVVLAGWFSISDPEPFRRAFAAGSRAPIFLYEGGSRPLSELLEEVRSRRETVSP